MIPARRTVVVGGRLLPGCTIDRAMQVATSFGGEVKLSIAALDRPDGTTVVAVSTDCDADNGPLLVQLASDLRCMFAEVTIVESDSATLASDGRLT